MEVVPGPGEGGRLVAVPGGPAEAVAGVAGEAAQLLEAAAGELVREGGRRQQPRHLVQPRQQQLLLLVEEGVGRPRPELGVIWRTGEVTHLPLYVLGAYLVGAGGAGGGAARGSRRRGAAGHTPSTSPCVDSV